MFALSGLGALGRAHAAAQTPTFAVEGIVTDEQQAVLPGATVTIRNVATGLTRTAVTDASGRYVFSALPPEGRYEIQVELTGFSTQLREQPDLQRRPAGGDQRADEAVEHPGDDHGGR